jgi:hypothetical protein
VIKHNNNLRYLSWTDIGASSFSIGSNFASVLANAGSRHFHTIILNSKSNKPSGGLPEKTHVHKSWNSLVGLLEGDSCAELKLFKICFTYPWFLAGMEEHIALFENLFPMLHSRGILDVRAENMS